MLIYGLAWEATAHPERFGEKSETRNAQVVSPLVACRINMEFAEECMRHALAQRHGRAI